jgi:hypothetical protein
MDYGGRGLEKQGQQAQEWSDELGRELEEYLEPLLVGLNKLLDKRLVRTFLRLVEVIICFRGYGNGLLLSELGGYLLNPKQAPAGTKRISNLLHGHWNYALIERFLWRKGMEALRQLEKTKNWVLLLWDESVWEKPESLALEGLGAVRSSQAGRLTRIKPGFYHPPGKPIFVPGMSWLGVVLIGMSGKPHLMALRWWSNRGQYASDKASQILKLFKQAKTLKQRVIHVFDQGFSGINWLERFAQHQMSFILRWRKDYKLSNLEGATKKAWQLVRGKRSLDRRQLWDARRRCHFEAGLYYLQVKHPENQQTYWLVVSRMGSGRTPWYLLTNQPITCHDDAWKVILAYARRWQIEMVWRFSKSELAFESPRLWLISTRLKLLFIATLAFAFLLLLLQLPEQYLKSVLLNTFCHRTGKRCRNTTTPLYRLRAALSRLWLDFPPTFSYSAINSG